MVFISKTVLNNNEADEVYIPREVMCRDKISDNTKLVFGVIFSECLRKMESINIRSVSQAVNALKNFSKEIPLHTIERECMCSLEAAESVRRELSSLIATLDIATCFYECELHYISVQKPVCHLCENGKMLYKMTDFVNTVIDRHLQNPDYCNHLSGNEIELFRKYNECHSPELLEAVVDILKK